jgi:hypothetical protein
VKQSISISSGGARVCGICKKVFVFDNKKNLFVIPETTKINSLVGQTSQVEQQQQIPSPMTFNQNIPTNVLPYPLPSSPSSSSSSSSFPSSSSPSNNYNENNFTAFPHFANPNENMYLPTNINNEKNTSFLLEDFSDDNGGENIKEEEERKQREEKEREEKRRWEEERERKEEERKRWEEEERKRKEEERRWEEEKRRKWEEEEKRRKLEEEKRKQQNNLNELSIKEQIRYLLFEGCCPNCKNKEDALSKGQRRICNKCKIVWIYNNEDGFFEKERSKEEKVFNGKCPYCNSDLIEIRINKKDHCKKCLKSFSFKDGKLEKTPIKFLSLFVKPQDADKYKELSVTYLVTKFCTIKGSSIRTCFKKCDNLLIPSYVLLNNNLKNTSNYCLPPEIIEGIMIEFRKGKMSVDKFICKYNTVDCPVYISDIKILENINLTKEYMKLYKINKTNKLHIFDN